jgi:hypothetical protein
MPKGKVFVGATVVEVLADAEGSSPAEPLARRSHPRIAADAPTYDIGPVLWILEGA